MTAIAPFTHTPNPSPAAPERVAEVLAEPGFGQHFTDHMVTVPWNAGLGWHHAAVVPYDPLPVDPAAAVLHYGQAIFEGLKAYRHPDGTVATFRPTANAARFRRSAARMAMPELPEALFLESLSALVRADRRWLPDGGEDALYLRPFAVATQVGLGVNQPSNSYLYLVIASPAGAYFAAGGVRPLTVWLSTDYIRAARGGTGEVKCAGNYGGAFLAQAQAAEQGCDQVVWLDATERRWVEEMGGMNLFFVFGSGSRARLVTPALSGSLLAGVTRDSLLTLGADLGVSVEERPVSTGEWREAAEAGALTEVFACGTAAVITPIGRVRHANGQFTIADGRPGDLTMRLRAELTGIQTGTIPDRHGWMYRLG
ncbi:MAG: branched-chain amino acid aminotransferase [Actinophytocola sp.]|uniref:branched-chain amino acid aminotransferase n=1 Tax=Actinophytocola sp. TaxID=1872138 RepID=UPI003D6B008A